MPPIRPELLDELLKDYQKPEDLLGQDGLLQQLTKALVERALDGELTPCSMSSRARHFFFNPPFNGQYVSCGPRHALFSSLAATDCFPCPMAFILKEMT